MLFTLIAVLITFCILVYAEWLARARAIHAELTRKLVHVAVGSFVAFWPFFLSWRWIQVLSLAFFVVVSASIHWNIFTSIHAVKRNITGELLFAIAIGLLASISSNKWAFTASMLHLSIADGLAAVIGFGWGDTNSYKVLGHTKSIAGSAAFLVCSYAILIAYLVLGDSTTSVLTILWLPIVATAAENISIKGTDNLIVPMVVAITLTSGI